MYDLIIRDGTIVDGTGADARRGDVAVKDGKVVAVGDAIEGEAAETVDADGKLVTPGFVDIHTHYDGQATWDDVLDPSAGHGVTTVVAGNCGVGFAPVHPGQEQWLIQLMEGVEDIPGTALAEGMTWNWETFPEYLDVLDARNYAIDIGTQVPHGAVRGYVMGERGARNEPATPEDIAQMAAIVKEGIEAGGHGLLDLPHPGPPGHGRRARPGDLRRRGRAVRHRPGAGRGRPRRVRAGPGSHRRHGRGRSLQGDRLDAPPRGRDPATGQLRPPPARPGPRAVASADGPLPRGHRRRSGPAPAGRLPALRPPHRAADQPRLRQAPDLHGPGPPAPGRARGRPQGPRHQGGHPQRGGRRAGPDRALRRHRGVPGDDDRQDLRDGRAARLRAHPRDVHRRHRRGHRPGQVRAALRPHARQRRPELPHAAPVQLLPRRPRGDPGTAAAPLRRARPGRRRGPLRDDL